MGGVPVKHHSKSKVGRRRSQQALKKLLVTPCYKCGAPTLPHQACPSCGFYVKSKTKVPRPRQGEAEGGQKSK